MAQVAEETGFSGLAAALVNRVLASPALATSRRYSDVRHVKTAAAASATRCGTASAAVSIRRRSSARASTPVRPNCAR